jgi:uncharacterized protein (TIGR02271 family)
MRDAHDVVPEGETGDLQGEQDEVLRVPEVEERLHIETRRIALGFIEVHTTVITEQVMVPVELRREVVEIRRVDDPGGVATVGEAHILKDDTIRIPVFREKAVVQKEIVVTSEVVIERTLITDEQTLEETLRRATVTVDADLDRDVPPSFLDRARRTPARDDDLQSDRDGRVPSVRAQESE